MTDETWRTPEAMALPFDQYQRYATAARVVEALGGASGRRVLEVGGAPGFLERFFPEAQMAIVDRYGTHGGNFVVADGAKLPFDDDAFEIVVTLDTLEHIPPQFRAAFLAECQRVCSDFVVLSAPHATDGVQLAEQALQSFVTARFGEVFGTLQEHSDNGLPLVEDTLAGLGAGTWSAVRLPSGYLPRWLLGMIFHHELLAVGLPELTELHRFYNERQSLLDNADPSYRQVVVASGTRSEAELTAVVDALKNPANTTDSTATVAAIGSAVMSSRLQGSGQVAALRHELDAVRAELAGVREELVVARTVIADRDAHLSGLRDQMARQREEHAAALSAAEEAHGLHQAWGQMRSTAGKVRSTLTKGAK